MDRLLLELNVQHEQTVSVWNRRTPLSCGLPPLVRLNNPAPIHRLRLVLPGSSLSRVSLTSFSNFATLTETASFAYHSMQERAPACCAGGGTTTLKSAT